MERTILHVDMNNCFASVECLHRPALREKAVAVGGDVDRRRGIILAKNEAAKACGVKTAETIWQAKQKCLDLVVVPPNYQLYLRFSKLAREIYEQYTDRVEPFGLDESWLDLTGCHCGTGEAVAERLRMQVKEQLGITVSVGVANNKVFAKLGSDLKKPDAVTVLTPENYATRIWPLPASDLLYVGPATKRKLAQHQIFTIGDLAKSDRASLKSWMGKAGEMLWQFANGLDASPVMPAEQSSVIKSIGNSTTALRDLEDAEEAKAVFYVLAESVAERLRSHGFQAQEISAAFRDTNLQWTERQAKLETPTDLAEELCQTAMALLHRHYDWRLPLRGVGIRAGQLVPAHTPLQMTLFGDEHTRIRQEQLEKTMDSLRGRFGASCIRRAVTMRAPTLETISTHADPCSFSLMKR